MENPGAGRFAPSPSGELHFGNLRTALLAWLFARSTGRRFLLRVEDLDRVRARAEESQLRDLAAVDVTWDGEVVRQSERGELYTAALDRLVADGRTFECFCTRRDIAEAASAAHGPVPLYPGTCRELSEEERQEHLRERPAALRFRSGGGTERFTDAVAGDHEGPVDDVVLRRNDGAVAYNLAVVVDDAAQGIDQVVRGDDLLPSTPTQLRLGRVLGFAPPSYAHVPLVLGPTGKRLAKRDGAVTLTDLAAEGLTAGAVRDALLRSLALPEGPLEQALAAFDPARLPREPWVFTGTLG
ncbi:MULTISPECIES: tRNA glutamyl-Q(34) synthetase GluQRS [Arthrobacter]|uniref:Glutamyl-Q tRNA(Asp) synthetase n=2 Tax=Arthrobacter TaxID=1663 RepID=A0ABU9KIA5_9MICC|nr:tRNA glutamyl-Q(34) synthetase GluQRS [Arthrobacter sp. YJM1]MDP5225659.1 tRNA glutamyl-Q(34) synthetase GluQRS [Arthrobacter sp. YJM1]